MATGRAQPDRYSNIFSKSSHPAQVGQQRAHLPTDLQPVLVENKAGADGTISGTELVRATPDNYTLLFATNSPMAVAPSMKKKPPYDPVRDFTPIADVGRYTFVVVVHPSVPAKTVAELIKYATDNPEKISDFKPRPATPNAQPVRQS